MGDWIACVRLVSLAALLLCGGAYCYGYLFRTAGFRPLHLASLCFTTLALAQLFLALYAGGGRLNADYAMGFLVLAGLAQAVVAIRARSTSRSQGPVISE